MNNLPSILLFILYCVCCMENLVTSYELKAVQFEGRCQVWYNNDRGWNPQRVQVYFFYDPAPFLFAQNWRTTKKYVFIHPENKQLFQLSQASINNASCNVENSAVLIPLANQTIYSTDTYSSYWRTDYRYSWYNNQQQREQFSESTFRQNQDKLARFLKPNGTNQLYQVWRDQSKKGQCKASLVYENEGDLSTARSTYNQLAYPASELRTLRTYPLYNCLLATYSCRSYHVFLVNEDEMTVNEVNIVAQPNFERRWDVLSTSALGRYWTNGSIFGERRRYDDEYTEHCSYMQDFVPITPQSIGKNLDIARPPPPTEDEMEEEEEQIEGGNSGPQQNVNTNGNRRGTTNANSNRQNNSQQGSSGTGSSKIVGRRGQTRGGRQNIKEPIPALPPAQNDAEDQSGDEADGEGEGNNLPNALADDVADDNDPEGAIAVDNDSNSSSATAKNGDNNKSDDNDDSDNDDDDDDDDHIRVNTANKISIGGGKRGDTRRGGKFTFDDNNSISISAGRKGSSRPKIDMNRQTSIKMKRKK